MTDEDKNWVIQWRYHPDELDRWFVDWAASNANGIHVASGQYNQMVRTPATGKHRKSLSRWHTTAYRPEKSSEYLYSVNSMKHATKHTLEEAMELWYKMRNSWKFAETPTGGWQKARIVRLYNVETKEEILPGQIDPQCIG